jgi:hypothetical protein
MNEDDEFRLVCIAVTAAFAAGFILRGIFPL